MIDEMILLTMRLENMQLSDVNGARNYLAKIWFCGWMIG